MANLDTERLLAKLPDLREDGTVKRALDEIRTKKHLGTIADAAGTVAERQTKGRVHEKQVQQARREGHNAREAEAVVAVHDLQRVVQRVIYLYDYIHQAEHELLLAAIDELKSLTDTDGKDNVQ